MTATVGELLRELTERGRRLDLTIPEMEARWLIAHVLDWPADRVLRDQDTAVPDGARSTLDHLFQERERGVPLAYLLGEWEFWGIPLKVTPAVLVPRPETELLIEWGIELLKDKDSPRIAEVGTGSGCIAIALAKELPTCTVDATDISEPALEVARENLKRHHLEARVHLHHGDLVDPLKGKPKYDLLVSNPPYIAKGDPRLEENVATHEPAEALYDPEGGDGLGFYRRLADVSAEMLVEGGVGLVELPEDGAEAVREFLQARFEVETRADLAGITRALVFQSRQFAVAREERDESASVQRLLAYVDLSRSLSVEEREDLLEALDSVILGSGCVGSHVEGAFDEVFFQVTAASGEAATKLANEWMRAILERASLDVEFAIELRLDPSSRGESP